MRYKSRLHKAVHILHKDGGKFFAGKLIKKTAYVLNGFADSLLFHSKANIDTSFVSIVDRRDVMLADTRKTNKIGRREPTKCINWVVSPPRNGGGHQNMFRFIEYLDGLGYSNNIYLYSTQDHMPVEEARDNVAAYANLRRTTFHIYKRTENMKAADALFATGWETAYPVLNENTNAERFYFVQDFEPLFYPVGTEYTLAENTYKFGFTGITAGKWLSQKLSREYGMRCMSYDFGAEPNLYQYTNDGTRKEVFFYARPVTERRAFDLGIMVLELFHQMHPDYIINLAGWDVSGYKVPFPYINHKTLPLDKLSELYNKCAVGLVLSLTNMSLMPLELLASGVIPVVNEGENNQLVSDNKFIVYAPATPRQLAEKMSEIVVNKDLANYAAKASQSVKTITWDKAKSDFVKILEEELYG